MIDGWWGIAALVGLIAVGGVAVLVVVRRRRRLAALTPLEAARLATRQARVESRRLGNSGLRGKGTGPGGGDKTEGYTGGYSGGGGGGD